MLCFLHSELFGTVIQTCLYCYRKKYASSRVLAYCQVAFSCRNPSDSCFSVPVACFEQESQFLFHQKKGRPSETRSVWAYKGSYVGLQIELSLYFIRRAPTSPPSWPPPPPPCCHLHAVSAYATVALLAAANTALLPSCCHCCQAGRCLHAAAALPLQLLPPPAPTFPLSAPLLSLSLFFCRCRLS